MCASRRCEHKYTHRQMTYSQCNSNSLGTFGPNPVVPQIHLSALHITKEGRHRDYAQCLTSLQVQLLPCRVVLLLLL